LPLPANLARVVNSGDDKDFPLAWVKSYGKGRVFFSAFGHSDSTYWNPTVLRHDLAGIQHARGDLPADDKPSGHRTAKGENDMNRSISVLRCLVASAVLLVTTSVLDAQNPPAGTGRSAGAAALAPVAPQAPEEGTAAYPVPPEGFNVERPNVPHGELNVVEYDSKTLGTRRVLRVYTPPGYGANRKYPVLYMHHGLGNTSTEWTQRARAPIIADNLLADGKMQPMVIIFPSGNATATVEDQKQGDRTQAPYGTPYEHELLKDIIPFVESRYFVYSDRSHRAIGGMSMGGGQTLNIGLSHVDLFAWIAAVAAAPNTRPVAELIPDPAALKTLNLLWLAAGNRDPLMRINQGVHTFLQEKGVAHVWRLDGNAHDTAVMSSNFYHFAQKLFRE
jgi:enterochelin esterase-like enzyme